MPVLLISSNAPADPALIAALHGVDYDVIVVDPGTDVPAHLASGKIDFLILTQFPPHPGTLNFCRELREHAGPQPLPLLLCINSATASMADIAAAVFGDEARLVEPSPLETSLARASYTAGANAPIEEPRQFVAGREITERSRVENVLRESEAKFRTLAEESLAGVVVIQDGRFKYVNQALAKMLGYSIDEMLAAPTLLSFVAEEDHALLRENLRRRIDGEVQSIRFSFRARRVDGSVAELDVFGSRTTYDGRPAVMGTVLDISERRHAEQALRESEERLRLATEGAALGTWHWNLRTGEMVWSDRCYVMLGIAPGIPVSYEKFLAALHPEDRARTGAAVQRALEQRTGYNIEFRSLWPDGTVHWLASKGRAYYDAAGEALRMESVVSDITERKQGEEALHESERMFATLRNNLPGAVYRCNNDPNWPADFVSEGVRALTGYPPSDFINSAVRTFAERIHPDDRERVWAEVQAALVARTPYQITYRMCTASGALKWMAEQGQGVYGANQELLFLEGFISDDSARKQAEAKIQRLNRMYAMLSGIDSLIVRVHDREELFREACRLAVEEGQFQLAWIGLVDAAAQRVTPVASAGAEAGFLRAIENRLRWDDQASHDESIIVRAVKSKEPVVIQDVAQDTRIEHKHAHAERGMRSVAVLPLLAEQQAVGVLTLGAGDVGFFDAEEMRLLLELAGDIAFALDHIKKEERINYLAYYDSLTGLANSALFHERLTQFLHAAEREGRQLAVCITDLDHFKTVNDALGRQAGDAMLGELAKRFVSRFGDSALVARLGADRFALVSPDVKNEGEVLRLLETTIPQCIEEPFPFNDSELRMSAKIGVALYPSDGTDAETLFRNAEAALKKAKSSGDRYLFYTQKMTDHIAEKLDLENRLRRALAREEFVLHYQAKVDAQTGHIAGVEALIRWANPEGSLALPMKFIPLLEETGIIVEVGAWVIRRAVEDYQHWRASGLDAPRVAVNVSAVQLRQRDFVNIVRDAINHHSPPALIELEITESLLLEDIEENIERLKTIHDLGVNIAIDDFGTGYSSLGYLTRLPAQVLKIDLSFIARMLHDADVLTLVSTMISLAHSMRLKVVAEGVETKQQANVLRRLQCDELQGYLISPPLPREKLTELLRNPASLYPRRPKSKRR